MYQTPGKIYEQVSIKLHPDVALNVDANKIQICV